MPESPTKSVISRKRTYQRSFKVYPFYHCHPRAAYPAILIYLAVISDYKQRLEKSLKTEKAEHQQVRNELENKLNEEKSRNEKATNEANLRFTSLQQHFSMMQTQYDDLQSKLKEVQDELKEVKASKESLKVGAWVEVVWFL